MEGLWKIFESLGTWSVLKCVSWSRTISALIFLMYSKSCVLFLGTLSPFALRETILSLVLMRGGFAMGLIVYVVCLWLWVRSVV